MTGLMVFAGIGIAAYFVYEWLQSHGNEVVANSAAQPATTTVTAASPQPSTTAATAPAATPATTTTTAPPASTPTAWQLAIATMKAAAGTNSQNYNQWFWYFQNTTAPVGAPSGFGVPNSVSPQLAALTAQIGGDPTGASNITAEQFAQYLQQARTQSGISGFGFNREPGIPASWLTTYDFDGDAYL